MKPNAPMRVNISQKLLQQILEADIDSWKFLKLLNMAYRYVTKEQNNYILL